MQTSVSMLGLSSLPAVRQPKRMQTQLISAAVACSNYEKWQRGTGNAAERAGRRYGLARGKSRAALRLSPRKEPGLARGKRRA